MGLMRQWLWFVAACFVAGACSETTPRSDAPSTDASGDEAVDAVQKGLADRVAHAESRAPGELSWVALDRLRLSEGPMVATHLETRADKIALSADASGFYMTTVEAEGTEYVRIEMEETGIGGEIGGPALPFKGLYLEVPYGVAVEAVVVSKKTATATLSNPVYPRQPAPIDSSTEVPKFTINADAYQQDKLFPENIVRIAEDGFIRGRRTVFLEINPVQYNPVTGDIQVHSDILIDLKLIGSWDPTETADRARLQSESFEQQAERLIENYGQIVAFPTQVRMSVRAADAPDNAADYLIITADAFVEEVQPLAEWKTEKGYLTKVVPLSAIGSSSTDIANYIQDAYDTWSPSPTYVLLVGDSADLPGYPVSPDAYGSSFVSDLPYSLTDGSDYWPDVVLGRLSVSTEAECTTVVDKILTYDKSPTPGSWFGNSLTAAYFQDYNDYNCVADRYFLETAVHAYDYLKDTLGQTVYTSFVNGNTCSTYSYRLDSSYFPHRPAHPAAVPDDIVSQFLSASNGTLAISNAINSGVGLVLHRDHGGETLWGDPPYNVSNILSLTNGDYTPVVLSINCLTGAFDYSTDSFAEVFQTRAAGGAAGVVAAVRVSYSGHNDNFAHGIMTSFWPDYDSTHPTTVYPNTFRVAEAMNYGKHYMYVYQGNNSETLYEFRLFHWFGDPEMEYRPVSPAVYPIVVPDSASPDDTQLTVGGAPVGAVIGVTQAGEVLGRAVSTGADTTVPLSAFVDDSTPLRVTVTNYNMMPFQTDVQLSAVELLLPSVVTEGDGVLTDAGTVTLPETASAPVVVSLSSSDLTEISVPSSVTVQAGQQSASFDITVIDDTEIDVAVSVAITASTAAYGNRSANVTVLDDEPASVSVAFASDVTEGEGTRVGHGTVSISGVVTQDVTFELLSSDISEIVLPETVTVPAGASSGVFDVSVVDDILLDGPQTVSVTAGVSGWAGGSGSLVVYDNEVTEPSLTVTVPERGWEGALLEGAGTVSIPAPLFDDLTIQLVSDDETEATVPPSVVIFAGETETTFDLSLVDDGVTDGNQSAVITAAAAGWQSGSDTIVVIETLTLPYYQDFSDGMPDDTEGFEYYSSNSYGRMQVYNEELLMDSSTDGYYALNEAILTLDMRGYDNIILEYEHTRYSDETDTLPDQYVGSVDGDGVSISADGNTWYTVANAGALTSSVFTISLDDEVARIQTSYDPSFGYTEAFKIKFQQYDNYAYSTDGRGWDDISVTGEVLLTLTLPESAVEGDGILSGAGEVAFEEPVSSDTVIELVSGDTSEITVPSSVTIPAGQRAATFDITVVDDAAYDGSKIVSISADPSAANAAAQMTVHDNESGTATVDIIPAQVTEGAGVLVGQGTVSIGMTAVEPVTVTLVSDRPDELTVPTSVTVPAGADQAAFNLNVLDDAAIDGPQTVTVTASITGWTGGGDAVVVLDDETALLTLTIPDGAVEGDGTLVGAGTVSISGTLTTDLAIALSTDDTSELTVPSSVVIPAGQTEGSFDLTILDDAETDGPQAVSVSAEADGFAGASAGITVYDNELDHFVFAAVPSPQSAGVPFAVEITAVDTAGFAIANYSGSADLTALGDNGAAAVYPASVVFESGVFNGSLQVDDVDTNIYLTATDGAAGGSSNLFDVTFGTLTQYDIDLDTSTKYPGEPFAVTITAADENGFPVTDFTGTVDLEGLVGGGLRTVEILTFIGYADTSSSGEYQHTLTAIETYFTDFNETSTTTQDPTLLAAELADKDIFLIVEQETNLSGMASLGTAWASVMTDFVENGGTIIVCSFMGDEHAVLHNAGLMDLVAASYVSSGTVQKTEEVHSISADTPVSFTASYIHPYTSSNGTPLFTYGGNPVVLVRDVGLGHAIVVASDFFTLGTAMDQVLANAVKFVQGEAAVPVAVTPTVSGNFVDGVWTGSMTVEEAVTQVRIHATDGSDNEGFSDPFDVLYLDTLDLSVPETATEGDGVLWGQGTVRIAAPLPEDLAVMLTSSDTTEATVPLSVTIPAGAILAVFDIAIIDDAETDGTQSVTIAASAPGHSGSTDVIAVADNESAEITLTIPSAASESDGLLADAGTVSIGGAMATDLSISLSSDDTSEVTVPGSVIIPAGQTSVSFDVAIVDDALLDGDQVATITASAAGFASDSQTLTVADDEIPSLLVTLLPDEALESAGVIVHAGLVALPAAAAADVTVTLTSADLTELTVPSSVTISAGTTSTSFDITIVDDSLVDGDQVVAITASASGYTGATEPFTVIDDDTGVLSIDIPASAAEGDGTIPGGTVTLSDALASDLVVALASDDTSEITVPASVTIPAGQTAAVFSLTVVDDTVADGSQTVTVTASAVGFSDVSDSMTVTDNDPDHFVIDTYIADQTVGVPFDIAVSAVDGSGSVMTAFNGTAALSGAGTGGSVALSPATVSIVSGVWTGSVTVSDADTDVVLVLDDGNGRTGESNPFDVTDGGTSDFTADFTVSTDWGSGYCVNLNVHNQASAPTTNWTVTVNTLSAEIYTQWNGNFSGNSGQITVTPIGWNNTVYPGGTNTSIGFCANRVAGGSDLPIVESAVGVY